MIKRIKAYSIFDPSRIRLIMSLQLGSLLVCSINMSGGARAQQTPTHHHLITLAATSSRPNLETLVAHEVLTHQRAAFHPYTCGLRGGAAALIGYGGARSLLG
jgi:hypothetical protein